MRSARHTEVVDALSDGHIGEAMAHVCMDSRTSGENVRGAGTAAALKVGFGAVHSPLHAPQQLIHCASSITAVSDSIGTILSTLCDTRESHSSMKAVTMLCMLSSLWKFQKVQGPCFVLASLQLICAMCKAAIGVKAVPCLLVLLAQAQLRAPLAALLLDCSLGRCDWHLAL